MDNRLHGMAQVIMMIAVVTASILTCRVSMLARQSYLHIQYFVGLEQELVVLRIKQYILAWVDQLFQKLNIF